MTFRNPITSLGGALAIPSIHSPDYSHGVAGWSIDKDGSAEFNDLEIRGMLTIENATEGVFVYNGTPALGNLIVSIASTNGSDPYGNKYPQGIGTENHSGFTSRGDNSETNYLIMTVPSGNNPIALFNHDNTQYSDGFIQAIKDGLAGKVAIVSTAPNGKTANSMELLSQLSDGSHGPVTKMHSDLVVDGVFSAGNIAFGNVTITPVANTPTSVNVSFSPALQGTQFSCLVSPNTGVPGTTVTGVGYSNLSANGVTLTVTRTNTTATTVSFLAIGK